MTFSRRLFRLWLILAGLWAVYIVGRALSFVLQLNGGEANLIQPRIITTIQWAVHWALIPPAGLLWCGWLIVWIGRRFRSS
jgi:hypothetical protein